MSDRSEAMGLASASSLLPPPNNSACGLEMNDQVTASTMPRAASARLARRVRSWIGLRIGLRGSSPRSNGVIGTLSTPMMRTISSTISALPCTSDTPGGHRDLHHRAAAGHHEAEMAEDAPHLRQRHVDAGEALHLAQREIDHAIVAEGLADHDVFRRRAAADFHHQPRRHLQPRHHEGGIDAALETITRIRIDAELAAGLRDVDLVPQRQFDQHVGGRLRAAGGFAAHDAGEQFDAVIVRDHAHAGVERVGTAVERKQRLAVAGAAHGEIALHFRGVEHMQRPGAVVGHEVGDIDQRVDRPQADRGQALLQPFRRRAVLDAAHQPQRKARTQALHPRPSLSPGRGIRL